MAKLEFMCTYANCRETKVPVVCTLPNERARFCCLDHAAVALIRRARLHAMHGSYKDLELGRVEKILFELIGDGVMKPEPEKPADMRDSPLQSRS